MGGNLRADEKVLGNVRSNRTSVIAVHIDTRIKHEGNRSLKYNTSSMNTMAR